ncbi:HigA family addiction module antitoxin [Rhodococcus sp. ABRD24]|uniref:HigA family addiction module antitoxin n=1 Tax=Rhodococcus sp. ABRD24 TaxID=2507582 RepID=UPI00325AABCC
MCFVWTMNAQDEPLFDIITPGAILNEECIKPFGITQHHLAVAIVVPPRRINESVHGKRRISPDTALRLARYFSTSERFWMNLQDRYDIDVERERLAPQLDAITPLALSA